MKTLKNELCRAFGGWRFRLSLLFSIALVIVFAVQRIPYCIETNAVMGQEAKIHNDFFEVSYTNWIGGPSLFSMQGLFMQILPIFAVLPFASSFYEDLNGGYVKNILVRTSRKTYLISKYIATFFSAACAVAIPLLVSFLITSAFLPSMTPEKTYLYTNIASGSKWSALAFSAPVLYILVFILSVSVFTGFLACLCLPVTYIAARSFLCYLFPFFIYLFFSLLAQLLRISAWDISAFASSYDYSTTSITRLVMTLCVFAFSFLPFYLTGVKKDAL